MYDVIVRLIGLKKLLAYPRNGADAVDATLLLLHTAEADDDTMMAASFHAPPST